MADKTEYSAEKSLTNLREARAALISQAGGVDQALQTGGLNRRLDISVSEALVLGLLKQGVRKYISVFGHGSTEIAEVLRIYQQAGLVRVFNVRNEIEGSHAAAALRWISGEKAAVVASIGPGPLQAIAASLMPLSNGIGVWYLLGDETTEDEGPNFQQIPHPRQMQFAGLTSVMNQSYCLHTPLALSTALRRGSNVVDHPHRAGPFYLLLPMNVQPLMMHQFNLDELPVGAPPGLGAAADNGNYQQAVEEIRKAKKVVVRVGGGAGGAGSRILELLEKADGVAITAPVAGGVIPYNHPRNMTVAGSKGSISGNYAMENADLLIAIGTRFVCQSDCSRTGYLSAQHVININTDIDAVTHYGKTTSFLGDANLTLELLNRKLDQAGVNKGASESAWFIECTQKKKEWNTYKKARYEQATLMDPVWKSRVFTQPAAIKIAADWARANQAVTIFDAGDVQAYGFQIVEDENVKQGITDGGASYMGFAASAILASGMADQGFYPLAFSGDGSFMMNPQVLIDAVQHRAKGCILLLDNRRMSAISALQVAQYGVDFATNDAVEVDYVALAGAVRGVQALHGGNDKNSLLAALDKALSYPGLTVIHVPVYYGPDPLGTLEAFGRWNVGIWSEKTQDLRHDLGL
ncbi:MAG TPA: thiamine pyrophosphate-dependent enzyme [Anaerolineaceae bacterium]|nr:thiamine pyrophosphate-dependent enzyme [Anaerolineaceae bacterium]